MAGLDVSNGAGGRGGDVVFWLNRTPKEGRLLAEVMPEKVTEVIISVPGNDVPMLELRRTGEVLVEGIVMARKRDVFDAFVRYLSAANCLAEGNSKLEEGDGTEGALRISAGAGAEGDEHGDVRFLIDGEPLARLIFMGRGVAMSGSALLTGRRVYEAFMSWMGAGRIYPLEA
jgi:hypothetical protein